MTEQTSALKSKENNNAAGNQTKQAKRRKPQNQMQQSHGKPPMQKAAPGTTKRIFGYVFQYKWRVALVVVCILVGAAAQAGSSLFLQSLIDAYILPMVGASDPDWMPLLRALTLMACLYAAGIFCSWLWQWVIVTVEQGTLKKIRDDMFAHQQTLPIRYFDTNEHGDIMSRYTNDTDTLRQAISQSFPQMFSSAVSAIAALVSMLWLSVPVTIFVLAFTMILFVVVRKVVSRSGRYFVKQQIAIGDVNAFVEEAVNGQKVIKVFNHEAAAKAGFTGLNDTYRDAATRAQAYAGAMMPAMGNLSHINYAITCCIGGLLAIRTGDLGGLSAFLQYTKQVSQPITQISQQVNTILSAVAGAERVFEIMEAEPEVDDGKVTLERVKENADGTLSKADYDTGAWAWKKSDGSLVPLRGDVRFDHVVFGYDDRKIILHDISLFAKPGQKIAFVGSTGAGKTTITSLINRFYEIQSGTITYDGINVRDIQKDSLRRSLGVVLQDTHLFTGTVADNIRYGRLDATDEEVEAAARLAGADGFIRHLPDGYQTVLTSEGGSLSQGERQLLNIARAACANPPVLILAQATSPIDTRTEKLIEKGMDRLMAGRTVFVIAHRLSTVRNSKAIMVLEQGSIIERGDHEDLLAKDAPNNQLYTGQAELA